MKNPKQLRKCELLYSLTRMSQLVHRNQSRNFQKKKPPSYETKPYRFLSLPQNVVT